ncbi:DNA-binding transcriptional repressor DeoR [Limnobaculum zhutongyuii]|uniref:DNA-binding transcriptional repressor DeoR n=1 Tax=Limnobaculum zhutongyuii TaxID=2498113 RepID=A0A411WQP7_9GAMM|nr:DNA-binding transcriptional repressor DeoR [Limnobaculum zhutongyuii]QBH98486.1 DNA-binding transcriptional repressor DeoR [Limnobaculum zhutongyuii]TQS90067.1 DNA-binding transcriptional repressor DeoR [Limnobaculum zhutongyuii]
MSSRRTERIYKLTQILKDTDKVYVRDAAQQLNVSEMTIRRDLNAEPSSLILLGGYIVTDPKVNGANQYFFCEQQFKNIDEKRHIGQLAAQLINDDEVILFDSGTTVPFIIESIPDERRFTGVCYSLNTFMALQEKPHCKVILCGGEFKTSTHIFTAVGGHNELNYLRPDKAFISAAGVSLTQGVTTFIVDEIALKAQAMAVASQSILVADHNKFEQVRVGRFASLEAFTCVVTDRQPDSSWQHYFKQQGTRLLY